MPRPRSRPSVLAPLVAAWAIFLAPPAAVAPASAQELPGLPSPPGADEPAEPELRAGSVEPEISPGTDRAIARRLAEIYGQVEGLEGLRVDVRAGVVRLRGEVLSGAAEERAVRIARQLQGVVEVESEVAEVRDVERRLQPTLRLLRERAFDFVALLPLLGVALLVFAGFVAAGRLLAAWERPYRRVVRNRFGRDLLRGGVRAAVALVGAVVALEIVDATAVVAAVAGVAGLAGLALSFAFRDVAENYIASVLLSVRQPFLPNDHVLIEGHEGHVVRLTSRATILMDLAGNHVRIPNATVFKTILRNFTTNPRRRLDFTVGVSVATDLGDALALGTTTLGRMPRVLSDPAPSGWIEDLGESNVVLHFFAWIDQRQADWFKARSEAIRVVKEAFDAAGVSMPEPIVNVRSAAVSAEAAPGASRPAPEPRLELDISPDTHLEREVAEDRAGAGHEADLLDPSAPRE